MIFVIISLIVLGIIYLPSFWVRKVLAKYSVPEDRYSGSGAELARHLLDTNDMQSIKVEETEQGDHYDPKEKTVRLSPNIYHGQSLTAITVAAHEVGHALQDHTSYKPLIYRSYLVSAAQKLEKLGAIITFLTPFIGVATRLPGLMILMLLSGVLILGTSSLVHFITLPTELDASFNRALPMLNENNILKDTDKKHARRILKAAAYTYLSSSLMSLLNIGRWVAILRR